MGRPSLENEGASAATTTPESIDTIFRKYDQQYPFRGGNEDEDADLQNDEPVMQAIIERLNEIINDDKPSDFKSPAVDVSPKQRSLLRKQNEELVYGSHHTHINRPIHNSYNPVNRDHSENNELLNLDQNVFLNKELLADAHHNRPAERVPVKSRIPVRVSTTRFPTRPTTTTAIPVHHSYSPEEKIAELIAEELLTKTEQGNKLSIPVLSVATEDFEEDIIIAPVATVKPHKISAQTEDFEEYRRQRRLFRQRRDESGVYSGGWMSRMASWFNFYGEAEEDEDTEEGRKLSALIKRQIITEKEKILEAIPEPVPVPEQVKSVDVPSQVADAVIETILDIDDPDTRNEFAKDVPAIEEKLEQLEEQAEAVKSIEVAIVELGQTEAEQLGTIVEPTATAINEVEKQKESEAIDPVQGNDNETLENGSALSTRSVLTPAEDVAAPPDTLIESVNVVPELSSPAVINSTVEDEVMFVEVDQLAPIPATRAGDVVVEKHNSTFIEVGGIEVIPTPALIEQTNATPTLIESENAITESITNETTETPAEAAADSLPTTIISPSLPVIESAPTADMIETPQKGQETTRKLALEDIVAITDEETPSVDIVPTIVTFENMTVVIVPKPTPTTSTFVDNNTDDTGIVIEPVVDEEPSPRLLPVVPSTQVIDSSDSASIEETPVTTTGTPVQQTIIQDHSIEEVVPITDHVDVKKPVEDPSVPLIISEEDVSVPVKKPNESSKEADLDAEDNNQSGSDSQSISTTESTSTKGKGSSEESVDGSQEERDQKLTRKEEKRREKEAEKREKQIDKDRKKAAKKNSKGSSEEDKEGHEHHIHLTAKLEAEEVAKKLTKEEMMNIFSSPEEDTELKTTDPALVISEVVEAQKNVTVNDHHVVIKKDGVPPIEEEDNSVESDEVTTITPDLLAKLDAKLEEELETVSNALDEIQKVIDNELRTEAEQDEQVTVTTEDTIAETTEIPPVDAQAADVVEQTNAVISSKNTRHLIQGYNGADYVEKDVLSDAVAAEARLTHDYTQSASETGLMDYNARAFVLVGSGLFLVTGFILFALVVIIRRSRRYGSIDLTIEP